jgi:hypothetical protein
MLGRLSMSSPPPGSEEVRAVYGFIRWLVTGLAVLLSTVLTGILTWFIRLERRPTGITYAEHEKICGQRQLDIKRMLDEKAAKEQVEAVRQSLEDWRTERRARDAQQDAMHAENRAALQAILLRLPEARRGAR